MIIRLAVIEDIEAINKLFYELDTDAINMQPEHFQRGSRSVDYLASLINDQKSAFLLAIIEDEIIGFSLLLEKATANLNLLVPCEFAYIQDFVVSFKYRNQGVGSRLMEESKEWAKARGLDYLRLSVFPENIAAQRFYSRHGLGQQMITMECKL